jgi:hypothetical protein
VHSLDELAHAYGAPVYAGNGERLGAVEEIFFDERTGRPEWIGIGTGFLRLKRVVVPARGATLQPFGLVVPYPREVVAHSPDVDGDELSPALEGRLRGHYGISDPDAETVVARHPRPERVLAPVRLARERVRVRREPVGLVVDGVELRELELELPLYAQEAIPAREREGA